MNTFTLLVLSALVVCIASCVPPTREGPRPTPTPTDGERLAKADSASGESAEYDRLIRQIVYTCGSGYEMDEIIYAAGETIRLSTKSVEKPNKYVMNFILAQGIRSKTFGPSRYKQCTKAISELLTTGFVKNKGKP